MIWLLMIPLLVAVAMMSYAIKKLQRRGRRSPFNEKLLRGPGHSLDMVRTDLTFDSLIYLGAVIVIPFFLFTLYSVTTKDVNPLILLTLGALLEAFCLFKATKKFNQVIRLHQGVEAEIATGQELSLLMRDGAWVFHDIPYQYGNIDHVIVSRGGIFAIETKGYSKPESSNLERPAKTAIEIRGDTLVMPNGSSKKPVQQALMHAKWLHDEIQRRFSLSVPVRAVLSFPGWKVERAFDNDCWAINPKRGNALRWAVNQEKIKDKNVQLIASWIEDLARSIVPKSKDFDSSKNKLFKPK